MRIYLDAEDLHKLLKSRTDKIGRNAKSGIADIFAGLVCVIPNIFSHYSNLGDIPGWVCNILLVSFGIGFIMYGTHSFIEKDRYTYRNLQEEILGLDANDHPFSIVAVKDSFNEHPNRFLLYHDIRWGCDFFFSYKTRASEAEDVDNIRTSLSNSLKVDKAAISVQYATEEIHTKFSVSDKYTKTYRHKLYSASISHFPESEMQDSFSIDGTDYKWMSLNEMMKDPVISEINMDVVTMVKNNLA